MYSTIHIIMHIHSEKKRVLYIRVIKNALLYYRYFPALTALLYLGNILLFIVSCSSIITPRHFHAKSMTTPKYVHGFTLKYVHTKNIFRSKICSHQEYVHPRVYSRPASRLKKDEWF
jgi:hypothetical protein